MRRRCGMVLLMVVLLTYSIMDAAQQESEHEEVPSFRSSICHFLCTKDPPEGGNFCNCDRHPLG